MKRILTFLVAITLLFSLQTANANEPCVACQTVSSFKVGTTTSTTASIYWNGVQGAKSYDVTVSQALPIPLVAITFEFKGVTTTTLSVTKLTAGTTYSYTIKTNCIDGSASELSKLGEFTTQKEATGGGGGSNDCGTVTDFSAFVLDSTSASIKWTAVTGATSYTITVTGPKGFKATYTSTGNAVVADKLPGNGGYTYQIKTTCASGTGNPSKPGTFVITKTTVPTTGCGQVSEIKVVTSTDTTSAAIYWSLVPGAVSYEIVVTGKGITQNYTSTTTNVLASKLPGTGTYTVKVRAICKSGNGDWSKDKSFTITKPKTGGTGGNTGCGSVAAISAKAVDSTSAIISWLPNINAKSYEITITSAAGFTLSLTSTTAPITVAKLPTNTTFTVKIRAICASGAGEWSKGTTFKTGKGTTVTPPTATCGTPNDLTSKAYNTTTIQLNWKATTAAVSYDIEVEETTVGATASVLKFTSKINTIIVDNLKPGSSYKFRVRATCSTSTSEWSKYGTFTLKAKFKNDDDTTNRVAQNTSNQANENTDLIRSLYPNPASNGDVTIALNGKEGEGKLFIVNMLGSIVKTMDINAGETRTLEIGDLFAGYYFVKVKIGDRTETKRLMVARP